MSGIYIHIPFCKQKCSYCDFASYPREIGKAEAYFACLYKEMHSRANELKGKKFDTVYFGGGTPSYVDPKYILGCMRLIKKEFDLAENAEITLEVNPGTIDRSKLHVYKEAVRRACDNRSPRKGLRARQSHCRKIERSHSAPDVRNPHSGGYRRQNNRSRNR